MSVMSQTIHRRTADVHSPRKSTNDRFANSPPSATYDSSTNPQLVMALGSSARNGVGSTRAGPLTLLTTAKSNVPSANHTLAPSTYPGMAI